MADSPSDAEPHPERVERALHRLAVGSDGDFIAHAERALSDLDRAAAFREAGGLDQLRTAVETADGLHERRARAVLTEFERFRRAARGAPDR